MQDLHRLSEFLVLITGPVMAVCLILMYVFLALVLKERPKPREVIYLYAKYHIRKKKHAGLLTYILILSGIFFVLSGLFLLISRL